MTFQYVVYGFSLTEIVNDAKYIFWDKKRVLIHCDLATPCGNKTTPATILFGLCSSLGDKTTPATILFGLCSSLGDKTTPATILFGLCSSLGDKTTPATIMFRLCSSLGDKTTPATILFRLCSSLCPLPPVCLEPLLPSRCQSNQSITSLGSRCQTGMPTISCV